MNQKPRNLLLAGIAASALLVLSACSSGDEPVDASPSSASASPSASVTQIPALSSTCASVYEVDLLVSDYNNGAVANGDFTENEALADYARLTKAVNTSSKTVQGDGAAKAAVLTKSSKRSLRIINGLNARATLGTMSSVKSKKLAAQRNRMMGVCEAAGYPAPAVNAQADLDVTPVPTAS
ncbi:MAG: hypothetical protein Q7K25_08370 [Actinomycetota bacterium]|nr:hypothetical protein [Actinomycetota bacterium]